MAGAPLSGSLLGREKPSLDIVRLILPSPAWLVGRDLLPVFVNLAAARDSLVAVLSSCGVIAGDGPSGVMAGDEADGSDATVLVRLELSVFRCIEYGSSSKLRRPCPSIS